jgi:predicted ATPase/DNA-binding winged helix-turn-helix (wHTH) protein
MLVDGDIAYSFGPFKLIPSQRVLVRDNRAVKVGGRALDILQLLVMEAGTQVSKDTLIKYAWPKVFVDERNLKVHISSLRRALQGTSDEAAYIATVVGHGYQFVGQVQVGRVQNLDCMVEDQVMPSSLPPRPTLVGRQRDIDAVARALDFTNCVTLVGPGGVGKSSLAIAVAHAKHDKYSDGIYFVDLSTTTAPDLVSHHIAKILGIQTSAGRVITEVTEHLRNRHVLIVLDNCEHVLHAAAALANCLVQSKIVSCLLATSREALGVRGENVQRVHPLAFPGPGKLAGTRAALAFPAVELFAVRARETAAHHFVDNDVDAVASLCEALDGLPLAIELAAAKLDEFSPAELLNSICGHRNELRSDRAAKHYRHQTLWATFDWSYRLLSQEESMIFRLLSVFAGYFEWTDVIGMVRLKQYDPSQTTTMLAGLVAKSLLQAEIDGEQLRYRLLESARHYAAEQLLRDVVAREAQRRHAQIVLSVFERAGSEWEWVDSAVWRARYEPRTGDLRKALDWCFSDVGDGELGIDIAIAATPFWNEQSSLVEQLFQVERAIGHCASFNNTAERAATLAATRAWCMAFSGQLHAATDDAWSRALSFSQLSNNSGQRLSIMCGMALFFVTTGRHERAEALLDEVIRIAVETNDPASLFDGERLRTMAECRRGKFIEAQSKLEHLANKLASGMPKSRHIRYRTQAYASIQGMLAFSTWITGRPARGLALAEETVIKAGQNGHLMGQSRILALFALPIAFWSGHLDAFQRFCIILSKTLERGQIALWGTVLRFYASLGRHTQGDLSAIDEMGMALDKLVRDRFLERTPMYFCMLAVALRERGRFGEAEIALNSAFKLLRQSKENWCLPELLRVRAQMKLERGERQLALAVLRKARRTALVFGAKSLELRVVNDMAQMAVGEGDWRRAVNLLLPLYENFESDVATEDMTKAGRLLAGAKAQLASANPSLRSV